MLSVWAIVAPFPSEAPDTPVCTTVQLKVVAETVLVNAMEVAVPEQIVCAPGVAVATGIGLTVMVTVIEDPEQPSAVGVMV